MSHAASAPLRMTTGSRRLATRLAFCTGGALLLCLLLGRMLQFGISRDEMMFVPPAALLGQMSLYSDVFFNHVPLSAWLFAAAHWVAPSAGLLLVARLTVFAAWLLLLAGMGAVVHRLSRSVPLTGVVLVALVTNDTLLTQAGMTATNNLLPLPFAVIGLGLVLIGLLEGPRPAGSFAAGLCLAIAVGMKISAVAFVPPVLAAALLLPRGLSLGQRLRRLALPGLLGGLVGAAPLLWYLGTAPDLFLAHVLGFHTGPHVAYWQANAASEPGLALSLSGKALMAFGAWLSGSALLLACTALGLLVWAATHPTRAEEGWGGALAVALGALAMTALIAFLPTPAFPQYYAPPLVSLPLVAAVAARPLPLATARGLTAFLTAALMLMLVLGAPRLAAGLGSLAAPHQTETARFAQGGRILRDMLAAENAPEGRIATLMPLYPLEAGLPVYPDLATGQFAYRVAEFTPPDLARHYAMTGKDGLAALFDADPPAAFLLGYEPDLEAPFAAYARAAGYRRIEAPALSNRYGSGILYVRVPDLGG